jgi:hypothetical protein
MRRSLASHLYRRFLRLHPEHFRIEFGEEMLEIFEESATDQGTFFVLADVILSAARQQIRYHTAPAPTRVPLYSETPESPALARMMAAAALVLTLAVGAGISGDKAKPREFQITSAKPRLLFVAFSIPSPKNTK